MPLRKIKIVSRASLLARIQARIVGKQLEKHFPNREIEYHTATASADRNMDINISVADTSCLP